MTDTVRRVERVRRHDPDRVPDAFVAFSELRVAPGNYAMVSWWESRELFLSWFRSQDHTRSHARFPEGTARPFPVRFRRFSVVAR